jgi:hypothetical protein
MLYLCFIYLCEEISGDAFVREGPHRLLSEGYKLIRNSVQSSTEKWKEFLVIFHLDNVLNGLDEFLQLQSESSKLEHIIAFAAYLHLDCSFKKETVGNYLSAIKYYLVSHGTDK